MKTNLRIQQACIRLVIEYGYDKTTMEDIAREAGVARSTIYTKWKTKEDLFAALLREESIKFASDWLRLVEADPDGGSFSGIYKNSLLAIRSNPFMQALYTQNRRVLGSFVTHEQLSQLLNERVIWTTILFEMMQSQGLLRAEIDAKTAASMVVAFRQGLLVANIDVTDKQAPGYEEVIELFTAMFRDFMETESVDQAHAVGKQILRAYIEKFLEQYGNENMKD